MDIFESFGSPESSLFLSGTCCYCIRIRLGIVIAALISTLDTLIAVFANSYLEWWLLWVTFAVTCCFSISCIYGSYALLSKYIRAYFWWTIALVIINCAILIYEAISYDQVCEDRYDKNSQGYKDCTTVGRKALSFSAQSCSIVLEVYFVYVSFTFAKLIDKLPPEGLDSVLKETSQKEFRSVSESSDRRLSDELGIDIDADHSQDNIQRIYLPPLQLKQP